MVVFYPLLDALVIEGLQYALDFIKNSLHALAGVLALDFRVILQVDLQFPFDPLIDLFEVPLSSFLDHSETDNLNKFSTNL